MKNKIPRISALVFVTAALIQIAISFVFIIQNITVVPQYGDTKEFLNLSKTLELDKFRTILYPLFLKAVILASAHLNFPYQIAVYIFQMAISLVSLFYLFNILFKCCLGFAKKQFKFIVFFTSLFVFSNPFVTHFNLSVLSDSFALSFTIFFLGSILNLCISEKISPLNILSVFAFYILMSLTRPERKLLGIAFLIAVILFELFKNRKAKSFKIVKKAVCVLIAAITAFIIISGINNHTQTAAATRNQPALYKSAFEFIVWPRLTKVYPYLPSSIKNVITYKDAVTNDAAAYNTNYTIAKILNHDNGNPSKIIEITKITLSKFCPEIIGNFAVNVFKNIFSPFCYAFNFILNDGNINWTQTRMSMAHPRLTVFYDIYSKVLFLILALTAFWGLVRKKIARCLHKPLITISVLFVLLFSMFFSAVSDMGFHIRYAMPMFTVFIVFTSFFAALTVLPLKKDKHTLNPEDCK